MIQRCSLLLFFILVIISVLAQEDDGKFSFNDKFNDANLLMEEKLYPVALPLWMEILNSDTGNSNWNYKVGLCYLHSGTEGTKSLPYLEKAVANAAKNYNPFSSNEEHAPVDAYYYLAKSYHLNNQIDKAIEYYNKFQEVAGKKHFLIPEVQLGIQMCNTAKEIMAKPLTVKITNIGNAVNTPAPEYGPLVSLDENALYFTSRRLWLDSSNAEMKDRADGGYFEDIYVSYKDMSGKWGNPEMLNFNRKDDHEATVSLAPDGQTIYLYIDDNGNGNLYQSFLFGETWTAPVPMEDQINTKAQETHLTVSLDNKTLFFVSDRKEGLGGKDIYYCTRLPNGKWSQSQNLGAVVNTPNDEDGPYIHPDGKTLYFSSKGHRSMGGYDIFTSSRKEDGTWTTPENIGYPINTTNDDIFIISSPDGKRAYYSSFRPDGFGDKDIYLVEQPEAIEKQLALIKGYISVPEGQQLPEEVTIVITDNETGEFITDASPLRRNRSFVFVIPPGKNYNISYLANGVEFYNENVYVPVNSEYREVNKEVKLDPSKLGTTDAVSVNIISSTEKPKPQWKIRYNKSDLEIPDSAYIQYLNEDGNVIYQERLSKSGFFAYHELEQGNPYLFTLKSKDSPLCLNGEIVIFGKEDSLKFLPDSNCIFREKKEDRPRFAFHSLTRDLPSDIIVQYLDDAGAVIYEDKMDNKGYFRYKKLPGERDYIVRLKSNDVSICEQGEITVPVVGGIAIVLSPDANCVYRVKEKKSTFAFDALGKSIPKGLTLQYLTEDGKFIEESKLNEKGEFKYRELSPDKPYAVALKTKDRTLCDQGEIAVPGPGGATYIMVADENCVFRVKEKRSQFVFTDLEKAKVAGLRIQAVDDQGKIIFEDKMDENGMFAYHKLPFDKAVAFKIISSGPLNYTNAEILVPLAGKNKSFYKFTPDNAGVFRRMETGGAEMIVSKVVLPGLKADTASALTIQAFDDSGKLLFEESANEKNEFSFEKMPVNKNFSIRIKSEDPLKYRAAELIVPASVNTFYKLKADESGTFRIQPITDAKMLAIIEKEKAKHKAGEKEAIKDKEAPVPVQHGVIISEKTALFDYNSSSINQQYINGLDEAVQALKKNPGFKIEISGHTDGKGTDDYNNALSRRRAENAAKYLASKGIARNRIIVKGHGESQPVAPNIHPDGSDNPDGRQKNRRIEIKVIS